MNAKLFFTSSFLLVYVFPLSAYAQSPTVADTVPVVSVSPTLKDRMQKRVESTNGISAMEKQKMQQKMDEFKARLQTIRDEKKKVLLERINTKISDSNQRIIARATKFLDELQLLLDKISQKGKEEKAKGVDTTSLDSAIIAAQNAIDSAKDAVAKQKTKEYVIQIATEATLRATVGTTVKQFEMDLKDLRKIAMDAKQAVQHAREELAKIRKSETINSTNATPSSTTK